MVEVVPPSSRFAGTGPKFAGYFRLSSVRHYLIIDTEARLVIHHHGTDAAVIGTRIVRDGVLRLDPPGLSVEAADLLLAI